MSLPSLSESGTLVQARGREWVVLPDSTDELLMLRPVGGLDEEITGVLPAVEPVESATFRLPSREDLGDFTSGRLLRDAARLSTRAAAGPFRSFGRIAVEPRPYQLVPLMMALRLDPVRMLIADDVGIGKTIEACLIARELLDRGEIRRLTVLCPPPLAEQWQRELAEKFHIEAELVLSSTIQRMERDLNIDESVFERHAFTVVSTDFIKQPRRAEDFAHRCPEFVIVDEAHGCTLAAGAGRGRQQRHDLLRRVTADPERHVLLVTATPHSGNEDAFRSLLSLLDEEFAGLPADLDRTGREGVRRRLARHLVQRRRGDIRRYLETDTEFPKRRDKEATYGFSPTYRKLFDDILAFAREYVAVDGEQRRRRVRYWSALALLRCVSSSPAAAAATLRSRTAAEGADEADVDEVGRRTVLDQSDDDAVAPDFSPGSDTEHSPQTMRRRLLEFARRAEAIDHAADRKLQGAVREIKALLKDGFPSVVFCRFIDTAEYVARHLREVLSRTTVQAVTGLLPAAEREARIQSLADEGGRFVLVLHRLPLRGHQSARTLRCRPPLRLGVEPHAPRATRRPGGSVRPTRARGARGYLLRHRQPDRRRDPRCPDPQTQEHQERSRGDRGGSRLQRADRGGAVRRGAVPRSGRRAAAHSRFHRRVRCAKAEAARRVEDARDRERESRSRFAHHTINPQAVANELADVREAIGGSADVTRFFADVLRTANVPVQLNGKAEVTSSNETPRTLRQAIGRDEPFAGRFDLPLQEDEIYLGRTSPVIEGLASWTLDQALDPESRDIGPWQRAAGRPSPLQWTCVLRCWSRASVTT